MVIISLNKVLYGEARSAQRFNPLTSYILPFWTEKVPFLHTFYIDKWYPFHKLVKNMESLLLAVNAPSFNYK